MACGSPPTAGAGSATGCAALPSALPRCRSSPRCSARAAPTPARPRRRDGPPAPATCSAGQRPRQARRCPPRLPARLPACANADWPCAGPQALVSAKGIAAGNSAGEADSALRAVVYPGRVRLRRHACRQGERPPAKERLALGATASEDHGSCRPLPPGSWARLTHIASCPGIYTFADDGYSLSRLWPRRAWRGGLDLCTPMVAPCLLGCPGTRRQHPASAERSPIRAAGQNGSSRHVPASLSTSSKRRYEQISRLLIRGFGVQVPGGAPVMTWGFIAPGLFFRVRFVPMAAPWLLARTDPAIRACQKRAVRRPMRGHAPRHRADISGRHRPYSARPSV